jgi:hypothetical protein
MNALDVDAEVYGLTLFGFGATIHGMPLMNILVSGIGEPSAVLAIVDCKLPFFVESHYFETLNLCNCLSLFPTQVPCISWKVEKRMRCTLHHCSTHGSRSLTRIVVGSIVSFLTEPAMYRKLAGQLLAAKYPRIHVQTCAAHSVSLFFSDICQKLW